MEEQIKVATEKFESLLRAQIERAQKMEENPVKKDFSKADKIIIGVCGGDGIGPVITNEAVKVLNALLEDEIKSGKIDIRVIDGLTIERRLERGEAVPSDTLAEIKKCDVLLKGPTTTPKGGTMESANVALRRELDLYANVRPVSVPEKNIDWIFYRENTEGEYVLGSKGVEIDGVLAFDFKVTTDKGTKRIARAAFEYAKNNGKNNVAIVTKANIMKKTDGKFSKLCHEVAEEYPDITAEDWYIDIMSANLVNPALQSKFQVFVLPNLYGDIITDEAAQIQGGVGTAGSASIGDKYAMFEAIHGSAPRMVERGAAAYANPTSMIKAAEMLLRHICRTKEADRLEKALTVCTETEKKIEITRDCKGATCSEFGDYIIETLKRF